MSSIQVRVSESVHSTIRGIAIETGESMQSVVERAIERYKRELFLENLNRDFETLRNNSSDWNAEVEERELWDATSNDGEIEK